MDQLILRPSGPLSGEVPISGAKNSVLKLLAATALADGTYAIHNVPRIADVEWMSELLISMGADVAWSGEQSLTVTWDRDCIPEAPYEVVERMRASIVVLGPLLTRFGRAKVALPGGDDFGPRPIDMHLRALEKMGASFETVHGYVEARCERLRGSRIALEFPSVGATENVLMAAVLAEGTTVIENAAREPEIADLASFLNRMGAKVLGAGSPTVEIQGVDALRPVDHRVIPDRIEAATYLAAVGAAGGEVVLVGARADHMEMLIHKLGQMGMRISPDSAGLWAMASGRLKAVDVATLPYPGLATDYKPFLVTLLALGEGTGIVTENLFTGRFRYIDELIRMGADIRIEGHHAVVRGKEMLSGAPVKAHDIRAGAALAVAALRAEGETVISDSSHIDRGYERFFEKMRGIGVKVDRK